MRPERDPDFVFITTRLRNRNVEVMKNLIFWKEGKLILECGDYFCEYSIKVYDYGRIDMHTDNWCIAIGSIPGVKNSYKEFLIEDALLGDE